MDLLRTVDITPASNRHILAFSAGALGAYIPTEKSNVHPLIMAATFALFFTKVILGDLDKGYRWTWKDLVFLAVVSLEGIVGGWLAIHLFR